MTTIIYLTNSIDAIFAAHIYQTFFGKAKFVASAPSVKDAEYEGNIVYIGMPAKQPGAVEIDNRETPGKSLATLSCEYINKKHGKKVGNNTLVLFRVAEIFNNFESTMSLEADNEMRKLVLFGLYKKFLYEPRRKQKFAKTTAKVFKQIMTNMSEMRYNDELNTALVTDFASIVEARKEELEALEEEEEESNDDESDVDDDMESDDDETNIVSGSTLIEDGLVLLKDFYSRMYHDTKYMYRFLHKGVIGLQIRLPKNDRRESPYLLKLYAALIMKITNIPYVIIQGYYPNNKDISIAFGKDVLQFFDDFDADGSMTVVTFMSTSNLRVEENPIFPENNKTTRIIGIMRNKILALNANIEELIDFAVHQENIKKEIDAIKNKDLSALGFDIMDSEEYEEFKQSCLDMKAETKQKNKSKPKAKLMNDEDYEDFMEFELPPFGTEYEREDSNALVGKARDNYLKDLMEYNIKVKQLEKIKKSVTTFRAGFHASIENLRSKLVSREESYNKLVKDLEKIDTLPSLFKYYMMKNEITTFIETIEINMPSFDQNRKLVWGDDEIEFEREIDESCFRNRPSGLCSQRARNAFYSMNRYKLIDLE